MHVPSRMKPWHCALTIEMIDYRAQAHPLALLKEALALPGASLWAEGAAASELSRLGYSAQERTRQAAAATLVIWSTPPGQGEVQAVLDVCRPERVVVFAIDPPEAAADVFLRRLAGQCKYALEHTGGEVDMARLAGGCAQRESTVKVGLKWLVGRGLLRAEWGEGSLVRLSEPGQSQPELERTSFQQVKTLLDETAAYRAYFQSAEAGSLFR